MPRLAALVVLLFATFTWAAPGPLGSELDWRAGRLLASAGAAADPRAPDLEIARVRAENAALARARTRLAAAAAQLPWAEGGVLADQLKSDAALARRVEAEIARARAVDTSYASDGGVRITAAVPLEGLRLAVSPQPAPTADSSAPTAILVDASKLSLKPVLGVGVSAGGARFAAPTVWVTDGNDPRAGARVEKAVATGFRAGTLALDMDAGLLERAVKAGALILVVHKL